MTSVVSLRFYVYDIELNSSNISFYSTCIIYTKQNLFVVTIILLDYFFIFCNSGS